MKFQRYISLFVFLFCLAAMAAEQNSIEGNWNVVSIGSDCVTTGWVQDQYEPKNGKLIGTAVHILPKQVSWGPQKCKTPKITQDASFEFDFFDGSQCRTSPGTLPKDCGLLMKKIKKTKTTSFELTCDNDAVIPDSYFLLSKDYLLAIAEGDFICLKRN